MINNKQAGMTGISWLIVLLMIGFFVMTAMKIIPIQLEAIKVRSALERLHEVPQVTKMSKKEVLRLLTNQFDIDDVTKATKENIVVLNEKGVLTVTIEYENRISFIKPYDIIGVFKEEVVVIAN